MSVHSNLLLLGKRIVNQISLSDQNSGLVDSSHKILGIRKMHWGNAGEDRTNAAVESVTIYPTNLLQYF
jgi:hypothetical protein